MSTLDKEVLERLRTDALSIFDSALRGCDIERAFARHLSFESELLVRRPSPVLPPIEQSLRGIKKLHVIAFGKAALSMLDSFLARVPAKLRVEGVCCSPEASAKKHRHIRYFQGGHPLPNEDSLRAAEAALHLLGAAGRDTLIVYLISGGGSSLLELPLDRTIPLNDLRAFYETLVLSGADIAEINIVRKFFSAIKGGRLAQAAPRSGQLTLMLADVPLKDLGVVASSPTLPNHSTWNGCAEVLARWNLLPRFPATVRAFFEKLAVNPPLVPDGNSWQHSEVDVLLSNHDLVNAARDAARALGYRVLIDNSCDNWPSDEASRYLLERFGKLAGEGGRVCLLSSGEVTVRVDGPHGCGGRNQHFALQTAIRIEDSAAPLVALSAGSDGVDGNSPAAGAVVDPTTTTRARAFHFDLQETLMRFNSCPVFTALGDAIVTGPTGNNLRDLRIFLAG